MAVVEVYIIHAILTSSNATFKYKDLHSSLETLHKLKEVVSTGMFLNQHGDQMSSSQVIKQHFTELTLLLMH